MKIVRLERDSIRNAVFTDASLVSSPNLPSRLIFVIVLNEKNMCANILLYTSVKSKHVARSVMAAELYAAAQAFDYATLRLALNEIPGRMFTMTLYTDSKSLYDKIVGMCTTTKKKLPLDLSTLCESYELRELSHVVWILSEQNSAIEMTKESPFPAFKNLPTTNRLDLKKKCWVERQRYALPTWAQLLRTKYSDHGVSAV